MGRKIVDTCDKCGHRRTIEGALEDDFMKWVVYENRRYLICDDCAAERYRRSKVACDQSDNKFFAECRREDSVCFKQRIAEGGRI